MKYLNYIMYPLTLLLMACSQDQMQTALGNPKHTCEYKTRVLATARNLSNKDLSIRFCSAYGDLKSVDKVVPADHNGHTYDVWTYENNESYYSSSAETCANKGMADKSIVHSFALLNEDEVNDVKICANFNGSASDITPAYGEVFVVVDKNTDCPYGFSRYEQSRYHCQ